MRLTLVDITLTGCTSGLFCSDDSDPQKQNDNALLVGSIVVLLSLYLAQLWLICYNIHSYIIGQRRYKVFHLAFFYFLAFIIVVSRIFFFTLILHFLWQQIKGDVGEVPQSIDTLDNFATYFELSLGLQQLFSIVELHLMLQYSCLFKTNKALEAQKRQQEIFKRLMGFRYCSLLAAAGVLVLCGILTLAFNSILSDNAELFIEVTSTLFAIVSALLLCQLLRLFQTAQRDFGDEFRRELNQIKWYLATFVATFTIRALALWLVYAGIWPAFRTSYEAGNMRVFNSLLFVFEFLFYNIIPIGYLSLIHYYNFKEDESMAPRLLQVSNTGSVAHIDETTFSESKKSSILLRDSALSLSHLTTNKDRHSYAFVPADQSHDERTRQRGQSEGEPSVISDQNMSFSYRNNLVSLSKR